MKKDIRFGLGKPEGIRSSSWKVWAGADSTVYIASRDVGTSVKVSLHPRDPGRPGKEWRVALTSEMARPEYFLPGDPWFDALGGTRVIDNWDSETCRLGSGVPLKQG